MRKRNFSPALELSARPQLNMEQKHTQHNSHADDKSKQQPITGQLPIHPTDAEVVNPDQHALKVQRKRSLDKGDKNKRIADAVKTIIECLGSSPFCSFVVTY
jgi:hypothetical protein